MARSSAHGRYFGRIAGFVGLGSALAFGGVSPGPNPVHREGRVLEQAIVEANRELLREQPLLARAALDRAADACRRLSGDADASYGSEIVSFDRAFHMTLDEAREHATAGRIDDAFNQLVWVQRSCLSCHRMARAAGFAVALPEREPRPESPAGMTGEREN